MDRKGVYGDQVNRGQVMLSMKVSLCRLVHRLTFSSSVYVGQAWEFTEVMTR